MASSAVGIAKVPGLDVTYIAGLNRQCRFDKENGLMARRAPHLGPCDASVNPNGSVGRRNMLPDNLTHKFPRRHFVAGGIVAGHGRDYSGRNGAAEDRAHRCSPSTSASALTTPLAIRRWTWLQRCSNRGSLRPLVARRNVAGWPSLKTYNRNGRLRRFLW